MLLHTPSASPHQPDRAHLTFPSSRCPPLVPSKSNTREQCAEAPLGRRRSDPAAARQCSRQSRAPAGGLTAEPPWLPSAASATPATRFAVPAASWCQDVRMPTVPWSPSPHPPSASAHPASGVRYAPSVRASGVRPSGVRPSSVRPSSVRPSGVRCPVSGVRYPVSGIRYPVRASGICASASASTLSAPVSPWSAWVRRQPYVSGQAESGNYLTRGSLTPD
jgi:hypothetical protein